MIQWANHEWLNIIIQMEMKCSFSWFHSQMFYLQCGSVEILSLKGRYSGMIWNTGTLLFFHVLHSLFKEYFCNISWTAVKIQNKVVQNEGWVCLHAGRKHPLLQGILTKYKAASLWRKSKAWQHLSSIKRTNSWVMKHRSEQTHAVHLPGMCKTSSHSVDAPLGSWSPCSCLRKS